MIQGTACRYEKGIRIYQFVATDSMLDAMCKIWIVSIGGLTSSWHTLPKEMMMTRSVRVGVAVQGPWVRMAMDEKNGKMTCGGSVFVDLWNSYICHFSSSWVFDSHFFGSIYYFI